MNLCRLLGHLVKWPGNLNRLLALGKYFTAGQVKGGDVYKRQVFHHWGEPLFGYYTSDDEWVLRRHVEMLTDAGVDFLVFDTTNHTTYSAQALKLFKYLDVYKRQI